MHTLFIFPKTKLARTQSLLPAADSTSHPPNTQGIIALAPGEKRERERRVERTRGSVSAVPWFRNALFLYNSLPNPVGPRAQTLWKSNIGCRGFWSPGESFSRLTILLPINRFSFFFPRRERWAANEREKAPPAVVLKAAHHPRE